MIPEEVADDMIKSSRQALLNQIVAYLDVQIRGLEQKAKIITKKAPREFRLLMHLQIQKKTLEQVKKWILDNYIKVREVSLMSLFLLYLLLRI